MAKKKGRIKKVLASDEIYTELERLIKDGLHLSEIEFSVCPDELKMSYINTKISLNQNIEDWIFNWGDAKTKEDIITNDIKCGRTLAEERLKFIPINLIDTYYEFKLRNGFSIEECDLKYLTPEKHSELLYKLIDEGSEECFCDLAIEQFNMIDEKHKLTYIINNGLFNLTEDITGWYKTWLKAKGRDFKIDSVLFD